MWETCRQNGFHILEQRFSPADFEESFFAKINSVSQNIGTHRQNNFIGSLLAHHSLQSTKYLSKWIEEKNRTLK
jgi:hypothetical protein